MTTQGENNDSNEFLGFGIAIVFILAGLVLFFGWESFGNEMILKIVSIPLILFGVAGVGIEITNKTGEESATDLGLGLAIIFMGLMIGGIDFPISLNILVLIIVSFGAMPVISSIFKLAKNENPNLSFVYRLILILGQISGAVLAIIEFFQFFIN